jgi:hypothetical protein
MLKCSAFFLVISGTLQKDGKPLLKPSIAFRVRAGGVSYLGARRFDFAFLFSEILIPRLLRFSSTFLISGTLSVPAPSAP